MNFSIEMERFFDHWEIETIHINDYEENTAFCGCPGCMGGL